MGTLIVAYEFMHLLFASETEFQLGSKHTWHANRGTGTSNETTTRQQLQYNIGATTTLPRNVNENISSAMPQPEAIDNTYTQC